MQSGMTRVVVVGSSCAGKTTFSRRLAPLLGIPHIELDALYWLPHWVPRPPHAFQSLVEQTVAMALRHVSFPRANLARQPAGRSPRAQYKEGM